MGLIGDTPGGLYAPSLGPNSVGDSDVRDLNSGASNDPIRINSRTYTTAASIIGMQSKPRAGVALTNDIIGAEFSPGINAGFSGSSIVAVKGDPLLKAGAGNLTGSVTAFEANIDFGTSGTRTITGDVAALSSFLAIPSTYTYSGDISFLKVRSVNIRAWDYFLNLDDANTGVATSTDPSLAATETRWLRVREGTTNFWIKVFPAA